MVEVAPHESGTALQGCDPQSTRRGMTAPPNDHAQNVILCNRAWAIVERVMPDVSTPHGFRDPQGFIASCQHRDRRNRLYRQVFARLAAKGTRAEPYSELKRTGTGGWL